VIGGFEVSKELTVGKWITFRNELRDGLSSARIEQRQPFMVCSSAVGKLLYFLVGERDANRVLQQSSGSAGRRGLTASLSRSPMRSDG
jgi:hypothetical protein